MKNNLTAIALAALVFWGCGSSNKVTNTGTTEVAETTTKEAAGSKTSTGLCKTYETPADKKKVYGAYSLYRESFKQDNFKDAMEQWQVVMDMAPGFRKQPFVDGEEMYKYFYENAESEDDKAMYLDKLFKLLDERVKCHGEEGKVLESKGRYLLSNFDDRKEEAYAIFEQAVVKAGDNTGASILKALFNKYRGDIKEEVKTEEEVMPLVENMKKIAQNNIAAGKDTNGKYAEALEMLSGPLKAQVIKTTRVETRTTGIEFADCKEAIAHYSAQLVESPNDEKVMGNYYARLTKMKCTDEPEYIKVLEQYNAIKPSGSKLYKLGNYYRKKGDYDTAIEYYNQAVEKGDTEGKTLGGIYYALGSSYAKKGQYSNARTAALKAVEAKPGWGAPYLLIGGLYAKSYNDCGTNEIEKAGAAWAAVDVYAKAKKDPASAESAQKMINTLYKYFPGKGAAHMASVEEGAAYKVECWIQRNTTVRLKSE